MTDPRFTRRLADQLDALAGSGDEPLDDVLRLTARTRQRPAWTFPERWFPMTEVIRRSFPALSPMRPAGLLIVLALLLAAVVAVMIGSRPRQPDVLPAMVDIESAGATTFTGFEPVYPAVADGQLWLTQGGAGIGRLDLATGTLIETTQIPNSACGSIVAAFGGAWTPTCQVPGVSRVDEQGNVASVTFDVPITDGEVSLAAGEDGLWIVAGALGDMLIKVDPAAMSVASTHGVPAGSGAAEPGFDSVWVTNRTANTVTRVDPATGTVGATIAVGQLPRFLAVGEGAVWVLNQTDGTVSRIDPGTNSVTATIPVGRLQGGGDIAVADGSVWVRGLDMLLVKIDPAANRVVATYGPAAGPGFIAAGDGALWVTAPDSGSFWRLPLE